MANPTFNFGWANERLGYWYANYFEDYLQSFPGSNHNAHDRYFLDKVAEKLLILKVPGVIAYLVQLMNIYLKVKKNIREKVFHQNSLAVPNDQAIKKKLVHTWTKKEWETIEDEITQH